ncbi:MAG: polysaccharide export protein [Acidobacteria bacterium]|nr:MAG: polysaccharide export protein [Acidobacteriota bacterium]
MESGPSRLGGLRRVFVFLISGLFAVAIGVAAQEPASGSQSSQGSTPGEAPAVAPAEVPAALVPGQPVSQAATSASGAPQAKSAEAAKDAHEQSAMVTLGPGDLIEVSVYNVPELATKVRVSNSGDVYLPLIDYVHVDGLTQEEAQTLIAKRLEDGGFVRGPHVTIFVDDAASQGVTVLGEITKPGIYPEVADHKLYELISQAGGFTSSASRKIAIIRRNQAEPIRIELPRNLGDDLSGNIEINPGDTITVPRAPIIYVVGDVGRPSGLLVDNGSLTVLQALALAGGTNRTAKLGAARIIHKTPSGMVETKLQIKKMLEAKSPDITLQADDILFIPVSGGRLLAGRSLEAAMSIATAVTIYSVHP